MANQVGELVRNGYASLFPLFVELSDMEASDEILENLSKERQAQVQSQQQQKPPKTPTKRWRRSNAIMSESKFQFIDEEKEMSGEEYSDSGSRRIPDQ